MTNITCLFFFFLPVSFPTPLQYISLLVRSNTQYILSTQTDFESIMAALKQPLLQYKEEILLRQKNFS